MLKIINCLFV